MRPALILFARAPVPGRVKTRLQPRVTPEQAAELHSCFVRDMLDMLEGLSRRADLQLHTDTPTDAWGGARVARSVQVEGDLGRRMLHAIKAALAEGRPQAVIVGSDSPTLPAAHVERLLDSAADVALGPCEDGGFYAIACRSTHPEMFAGVQWSGPLALEQTVRAARDCGLTVELGFPWFDVDRPADLEHLAQAPALPPHTARWLRRRTTEPAS